VGGVQGNDFKPRAELSLWMNGDIVLKWVQTSACFLSDAEGGNNDQKSEVQASWTKYGRDRSNLGG